MLAFMAVVGALFIHIGVTLYAGAEVMKTLIDIDTPDWWTPLAPHLDFNIAVSIGIVSLLTIIHTALGGLKAVVVLTTPPTRECLDRHCWPNPLAVITQGRITGVTDPRVLALLLVLMMVGCYWVFA